AAAWTASFWILTLPGLWYAGRPIDLGIFPVLAAVWKYTVASLLAGAACFVIVRGIQLWFAIPGTSGALIRIVVTSSLFSARYLGAVVLLHGGLEPLRKVARLVGDLIPRASVSEVPLQTEVPVGAP